MSEKRLLFQASEFQLLELVSGSRGGQGRTVEIDRRIGRKLLVYGLEEGESLVVPSYVCLFHNCQYMVLYAVIKMYTVHCTL